jgi:hypothetical protein
MKLTKDDKNMLREWGYVENDFPQIEKATRKTVYTTAGDVKISLQKAIELLGRKKYLSGIARSSFHMSAIREYENGKYIYFDSSDLFA